MEESGTQEKDPEHFNIRIIDNGIGVSPENVTRIFSHGFGLHASANAIKVQLNSEGEGKSAEFIIELPFKLNK